MSNAMESAADFVARRDATADLVERRNAARDEHLKRSDKQRNDLHESAVLLKRRLARALSGGDVGEARTLRPQIASVEKQIAELRDSPEVAEMDQAVHDARAAEQLAEHAALCDSLEGKTREDLEALERESNAAAKQHRKVALACAALLAPMRAEDEMAARLGNMTQGELRNLHAAIGKKLGV